MTKNRLKIKLKSYDVAVLDSSVNKIIELVKMNNVSFLGPIPLPIKKEKITILRATHKYKDSREQFERVTYTRLLYIKSSSDKSIRELSNLSLPYEINVEIEKE